MDYRLKLNPGVEFAKPWKDGNRTAYHLATSLDAALHGFRRYRTYQSFILTDEAIERGDYKCSCCKQPLTIERGNRGDYDARSKTAKVMHYDCSWGAVFEEIIELSDHL